MNTLEVIATRRSIRRFKDTPVPDELIEAVLMAGIQAPSGKNRQPWRFIVVTGERRAEMLRILRAGIDRAKAQGEDPGSSEWTARVMEQAPVTIFITNPDGTPPWLEHTIDQMVDDVVDIQSVGAAIQTMLLAAVELGLGSLWICDVFYAYEELMDWLCEKGELIAAVSLGFPDESPAARGRKSIRELVRWM